MSSALPPGKYALYPAITSSNYSTSLVVTAPNTSGAGVSVQGIANPLSLDQQWIITGDGYITNLGNGNYIAYADEGNMQIKSTTSNLTATKFLISVDPQTSIPGFSNVAGWTGTIRTPDGFYYYWDYTTAGDPIELGDVARPTTNWAFVPIA